MAGMVLKTMRQRVLLCYRGLWVKLRHNLPGKVYFGHVQVVVL